MELDSWMTKIRQAGSHQGLFAILDDFRKLDWTDEERSKIAKLYMRVLDNLGPAPAQDLGPSKAPAAGAAAAVPTPSSGNAGEQATPTAAAAEDDASDNPPDDGPVWYEKM